jgi:putative ABC transport system substrate-binding protein
VLGDPTWPGGASFWKAAEDAAQQLGLGYQVIGASAPGEVPRVLGAGIAQGRPGALMVFPSPTNFMALGRIAEIARQSRLPTTAGLREFAEAGLLISYGPSFVDLATRSAGYVDRILRGAKPADLPVEQPATFELIVNLRTAKALGLTIPQSVLLRADHVIQ